jgi:hypothetical protein
MAMMQKEAKVPVIHNALSMRVAPKKVMHGNQFRLAWGEKLNGWG